MRLGSRWGSGLLVFLTIKDEEELHVLFFQFKERCSLGYLKPYYNCHRQDLSRLITPGNNRILDVGCGEGLLGKNLKQQGLASEVVGIEILPDVAKVAETRLDRVICWDIEMRMGRLELDQESFDYIICGDVLEHLRDPWEVVKVLVALLKDDGFLIVSVPNIRHYSVMFSLLFLGEWKYEYHGIMDRTHLRFFTQKTVVHMLVDSGMYILSCEGQVRRKRDKLINLLLLGMGKAFLSTQWTLVGKKTSGG